MKVQVRTTVSKDRVNIQFPPSVKAEKVSMTFDPKTGVVTLKEDPKNGVKIHPNKTAKRVMFGKAKWGKRVPVGKFLNDVEWKDGKASFAISPAKIKTGSSLEQIAGLNRSQRSINRPKPQRKSVEQAVHTINNFLKHHSDYEIVIEKNQIRLECVDIIG